MRPTHVMHALVSISLAAFVKPVASHNAGLKPSSVCLHSGRLATLCAGKLSVSRKRLGDECPSPKKVNLFNYGRVI